MVCEVADQTRKATAQALFFSMLIGAFIAIAAAILAAGSATNYQQAHARRTAPSNAVLRSQR
jgi:amino acid transporter